ncbi:MAG: hypothetical protein GTO30_13815 [Acidobacteria bacterium]|nr:hypothetical protein [Acidobacteriota bacterium]NIM62668.1 hypothetical protein [Acidobacteriota bacterium]NIO59908.1 hypothetical protein [Acidobacteriota bacterium]NIQ86082.1 hypothetical protein [Acidobacteriota bacterium]NIT11598.1 hypothetical protein [Acidobacteriota bacterium]
MRRLILILGLSLTVAAACRAPVREYACRTDPQTASVDVHAVWSCNRDVLRRIARGKEFTLREFRMASEFFEELTGLRVDWDGTYVGMVPGREIRQDLEDLDAWYELNKDKLTWDAGLGRIVYEGLAPVRGGS